MAPIYNSIITLLALSTPLTLALNLPYSPNHRLTPRALDLLPRDGTCANPTVTCTLGNEGASCGDGCTCKTSTVYVGGEADTAAKCIGSGSGSGTSGDGTAPTVVSDPTLLDKAKGAYADAQTCAKKGQRCSYGADCGVGCQCYSSVARWVGSAVTFGTVASHVCGNG